MAIVKGVMLKLMTLDKYEFGDDVVKTDTYLIKKDVEPEVNSCVEFEKYYQICLSFWDKRRRLNYVRHLRIDKETMEIKSDFKKSHSFKPETNYKAELFKF